MVAVFIATPVYKGQAWVAETLRSIRAQTWADFRALISVDGDDRESAEICEREIRGDPRFELIVQSEQLGWAGNLNWLMARCDAPSFLYWPHDDHCASAYLERLHAELTRTPQAACTYCDMQWFGARADLTRQPSIEGLALLRVLWQIERLNYAAFRGLVRTEAMRAAGPLRVNAVGSSMEDLVWVAKVAREGELRRVPETLYFKRAHVESAHAEWFRWPPAQKRDAWMEMGLGFIEAALPLLPSPADHAPLLERVLSRLLSPRPGRWLFYVPSDAAESRAFVKAFMVEARTRFGLGGVGPIRVGPRWGADPASVGLTLVSRNPGAG